MKIFLTSILLFVFQFQPATEQVSVLEFVQVLNDNHSEAEYYYQNNWKKLREQALTKEYIADFKLVRIEPTEELPAHLILMTTYKDMAQYEKAEENFGELIETMDGLKLLNEKEPNEFRKMLYSKGPLKNLE